MSLFAKVIVAIVLLGTVDNSEASGGGLGFLSSNFVRNLLKIQNRVQEKVVAVKENVKDNISPNIEKLMNVTAESAKEFVQTSKQMAAKVETTLGKITNVFSESLVPEVRHTGQYLRNSINKIMDTAERLENRTRLSLDRFDEMVKNIGKNVNHGIDVIIVIVCIVLFVICNIVMKNCQTLYGTCELLSMITILSLITGVAVLLRMFLTGVLQLELGSADIFKYCVLCPFAVVVGVLVLKLLWKIVCQLSIVVTFFLQVPGLVIYIVIAGPALWTWRAYIYSGISKCKKPFILSITLPWNTVLIWFIVFHQMVRSLRYDNETSFLTGLLAAYIYMYCNALYLYKYHQRPTVQQQLRHLYSEADDGKQNRRLCLTENSNKQREDTKRKMQDGRFCHQDGNTTRKRNTTYNTTNSATSSF